MTVTKPGIMIVHYLTQIYGHILALLDAVILSNHMGL